jgi:osmotically-inducible protein OsmY
MRNDSQLRQDVLDELKWDPSINEAAIGIAVKDGVVTLSGVVDSYAQKYRAEKAAERVTGVRAVADEVHVKLPSSRERSDTDIARAAINALDWDIEVPDQSVRVRVDEGWVWLEGTVEWQYQKTAAERAVRYLTGVKGVTNLMQVKPKKVSTADVSQKITEALRRTAEHDAEGVIVDVADGHVTLRGKLRSWAERVDAERAAWSAPGVTAVEDRILIEA